MDLIFASHNKHKLEEVQEMMGEDLVQLSSLEDIAYYDEIIEDGSTLEENARIKSNTIYTKTGKDVFSDDTGLEVYALDMQPGVITARFAGAGKDANANMNLLLKLLDDKEDRRARFRTAIVLILDGKEYLFEGIVEGRIAFQKSGDMGFGYDPVFIPEDHDKSFAEMPMAMKNTMSHRHRALQKMKQFLINKKDQH